jgi:T4 RnlA family RNA ligase
MNIQELYDNLMRLCESDDSFFYVDQVLASHTYKVFNYRLASYSQWLSPGALEARGITFRVEGDKMVELVSLPFGKFFNYLECPFTMNLDLSTVVRVQDKFDGSLISSMKTPDGKFWLKSKGSLFSEQAQAANHLIKNGYGYGDLHWFVQSMTNGNCTVIMEYVAPTNRIVIGYPEERLVVLAVRNNTTGLYSDLSVIASRVPELARFMAPYIMVEGSMEDFVNSIPEMQGIEGYVLELESGQRVKIKTTAYLALHHLKDSINSKRRLYEAVVYETSDDLRAAYFDDPVALQIIIDMEKLVVPLYNHAVNVVESFYRDNKHLDKKSYAIKGQQELDKKHFGLAMSLYIGRPVDYKAFMVKYRIEFGIKDGPIQIMED